MLTKKDRTPFVLALVIFLGCIAWGLGFLVICQNFHDAGNRYTALMIGGLKLARVGELKKAEAKLSQAVLLAKQSQDPCQLPQALLELSNVYAAHKHFSQAENCILEAIKCYQALLANRPPMLDEPSLKKNLLDTRLKLARLARQSGQLQKAEQLYRQLYSGETALIAGIDPQASQLSSELLTLLRERGKETEARSIERGVAEPGSIDSFEKELNTCVSLIEHDQPYTKMLDQLVAAAVRWGDAEIVKTQLALKIIEAANRQVNEGKSTMCERNLDEAINLSGKKGHTYWLALLARARLLSKNSKTAEQTAAYKQVLKQVEAQNGQMSDVAATALFELGSIEESEGRYGEAERYMALALAVFEKLGDARFILRSATELAFARQQLHMQNSDSSLPIAIAQTKRLELRRGAGDEFELDKLADCCARSTKYKGECESLLTTVLELSHKNRPGVYEAGILNKLAGIATKKEDYKRAEELFSKSQSICEKANAHEELASTLVQFALMASKQGAVDKAESLFKRALEITQEYKFESLRVECLRHYNLLLARQKS